jgi:hypothetical protein
MKLYNSENFAAEIWAAKIHTRIKVRIKNRLAEGI